jgi:hypothetical protein
MVCGYDDRSLLLHQENIMPRRKSKKATDTPVLDYRHEAKRKNRVVAMKGNWHTPLISQGVAGQQANC